MKKKLALVLAAAMMIGAFAGCSSSTTTTETSASPSTSTEATTTTTTDTATTTADLNVAVFYYNFADVYISSVRTNMDAELDALGVAYQNYDAANSQPSQTDQISTAIVNGANLLIVNIVETSSPDAAQSAVDAAEAAGIPIIFFNREVSDDVVNSYDLCAFVGTDAPEAGHMQGTMIGDFLVENYDAVDLNGDGVISYAMFKGQEGNAEAEYRTQFAVEDADAILTAAGYPTLEYFDAANTSKYQVDLDGAWSAAAATNYMDTNLGQYSESNGNMIEIVICNNDGMAEGVISSLQTLGYNTGDASATVIPVFGVDATDSAKLLIDEGKMTGTIMQDAVGMATTIATLVGSVQDGEDLMADAGDYNVDDTVDKIRVPYGIYG